jgi:hypothetical protein
MPVGGGESEDMGKPDDHPCPKKGHYIREYMGSALFVEVE